MNIEQFKQIFPANKNPEDWIMHFDLLRDFSISTPRQIAHFCQQIGHEQNDMTILVENLNYSKDRLLDIFPRYFNSDTAAIYARNPEMIANRVYSNRMANWDEASGDGWKYRGRGCIQCTGRANYAACQTSLYGSPDVLLEVPEHLQNDPKTALLQSLWYWQKNRLQALDDVGMITKRVNGSQYGLADRQSRFSRAMAVLTAK